MLTNIKNLIPLEKVYPHHLANLESMIVDVVNKPIIADIDTGVILDGSHRYVYFMKYGYETVPVKWVKYSDENIRVGTRLAERFILDREPTISKQECVERALSGDLFSPRTTRHFFPFRKTDEPTPLASLEKGEPREISHLIADVDVSEEIAANNGYIEEIDEEIDVVLEYLAEVRETKQYLQKQVAEMKQTAFMPGKFNPPHIGHIQTILKLKESYNLIVGVTGDIPKTAVMTQDEIINELKGLGVEVVGIDGVLTHKRIADGLPKFDVLLSGNNEVLAWATKLGVPSKFVPRSGDISGTKLRNHENSK
jgi:hypothetical protein